MRWFIAGPTAWALALALAVSAAAGDLPLGSTPGDGGGNGGVNAAGSFVADAEPRETRVPDSAEVSHPAGIGALPADAAGAAITSLGVLVFGDVVSVDGPRITGEPRVIDAPEDVRDHLPGPSLGSGVQVPLGADLSGLAGSALPPSPAPSLSFEGMADTGFIPPDTQGAVGPDHLIVVTNGAVRVMDRTGGVVSTMSGMEFWSFASADVFDPRVLYDALAGRWIVTAAADRTSAQSSVFLAVSVSSDPTGAWSRWAIDADAADLLWADQPKVGFSGRWLVVTASMFPNVGGRFVRPLVMAFDKADLYAGSSASGGLWPGLDPTTWGFGLVPAETLDASTSDLYVLAAWSGSFLQLAKVSGPVGGATLSVVGFVASPEPWAFGPLTGSSNFAPQLGTGVKINAGDDRIQNLVFRNGSLWAAHTVFLPTGSPDRASVQWWNIGTDASVLQRGRIDDPSATFMYAYPSIGVNSDDDILIGFTRFSASEHPSAGLAFRFGTDPLNQMRDETIYKAGQTTYVVTDTGGRNRWGDYSATVVDPLNDVDLWTIQEVTSTTPNEWSTWWAKVEVSTMDNESPTWAEGAALSVSDVGPDQLTVSWPSASDNVGVTGYRVSMNGLLVDGLSASTRTRAFTGLVQATTYTFAVAARDAAGNWSSALSGSFATATDAGVTVTPTSVNVAEGGATGSYTVVLDSQPVANVTVNATVTGGQVTVVPSDRTFTSGNWNVPQTFTVVAVDDPVAEGSHGATVTHSVASADPDFSAIAVSDVAVSIIDDDIPGVKVTPTTVGLSEGGAGSMFTVVLDTRPSGSVTVTRTMVGSDVAVSPVSRMFTTGNWDVPQSFTVVAVDDPVVEGPHGDTVTLASSSSDSDYQAVGVPSVTVDITDNDKLAVTLSGPSIGAPGAAATFSATVNVPVGSVSLAWGARRAGIVVATGTAQDFTFTPAVAVPYVVSVIATDNNGSSSVVTKLFKVLGDVAGSVFVDDIIWMANEGITSGCNPPFNDDFCPTDVVTRGQMAAFVVRALGLTDQGTVDFVDDDGSIFEADIEKLAAAGITRGCNPPVNDRFCPDSKVTRGAMAAFLVRALGLTDDGGGNLFIDDDGSIFEADIDKLGTAGVTRGCNPPDNDRFCPDSPVTRGQMAAFLLRALG